MNKSLKTKDYLRIFLLYGIVYATIPIIIAEITWDSVANLIGLSYAIIEKAAVGNAMSIILGIIFPMHIIWQMNQGRHFYKYKKAKAKNDTKKAKTELLLATFIIFLIHGCWDALISLVGYFASTSELANADIIGGILLCITIIFGIIYIIVSIIKIRKVLKNNREQRNIDCF